MAKRRSVAGQVIRTASALCCLAFVTPDAGAQTRLSSAEAAQLFSAAGFRIVNNQPLNRCGKPAKPRVSFVDINGDKRPEALFVDADAQCYAPSGRHFVVLAKEGSTWRPILSGTGSIKALSSRTAGWLDMRTADSNCVRSYRYDGRNYVAATDCSGRTIAAAPPPASTAQVQPAQSAPAQPSQSAQAQPAGTASITALQPADEAAVYKAAGFTKRGGTWRSGCDDPTPTYQSGRIEQVADLNGDGLPDVVISEGGTYCYGNTGQAYWLVSKGANGSWKLMTNGTGIAEFLRTKGVGGWPDISVGGPGFCFPVERWNGKEYKLQRWEYEGKACKPPR
jgi:hypothetical protein